MSAMPARNAFVTTSLFDGTASRPLSSDEVLRIARVGTPHPISYLMPPDAVEPASTALGVVNRSELQPDRRLRRH